MYRKSDLFLSPSECNEKNHKTNVTKIRKIPKTNVTKIGKHVFNTQNECNENQAQNLQKTNVTKVLTPNSYVHKLSDFVTFVLCKSNFGFRYIRFVYNFWFSLHSFCLIFVLIFVTSFHVKKKLFDFLYIRFVKQNRYIRFVILLIFVKFVCENLLLVTYAFYCSKTGYVRVHILRAAAAPE